MYMYEILFIQSKNNARFSQRFKASLLNLSVLWESWAPVMENVGPCLFFDIYSCSIWECELNVSPGIPQHCSCFRGGILSYPSLTLFSAPTSWHIDPCCEHNSISVDAAGPATQALCYLEGCTFQSLDKQALQSMDLGSTPGSATYQLCDLEQVTDLTPLPQSTYL